MYPIAVKAVNYRRGNCRSVKRITCRAPLKDLLCSVGPFRGRKCLGSLIGILTCKAAIGNCGYAILIDNP